MKTEPENTVYGDTEFKSRLEARWAVLLEHAPAVDFWIYEPRINCVEVPAYIRPAFCFYKRRKRYYQGDFCFAVGNLLYSLEVKPTMPSQSYLDFFHPVSRYLTGLPILSYRTFYKQTPTILFFDRKKIWRVGDVRKCKVIDWGKAYQIAKDFRFDLRHPSPRNQLSDSSFEDRVKRMPHWRPSRCL